MLNGEELRSYFYLAQIGIGALFIGGMFYLRGRASARDSGFLHRDPDSAQPRKHLRGKRDPLAEARKEPNRPLRLAGISISGAPHEILGIRSDADVSTIQKAYRELMKKYHPDLVGRPGSREWNDAQKIAEAINRAKDVMIKAQSQRP